MSSDDNKLGNLLHNTRIGFIGGGKMAQALSQGFITAGLVQAENIWISCLTMKTLQLSASHGIQTTLMNRDVVEKSDVIFLAVKPQCIAAVLCEISSYVTCKHLIVSIAAGITIKTVELGLPPGSRIIRVMPNTPAMVGSGVSVCCAGKSCHKEDATRVCELLRAVGTCDLVSDEHLVDVVCGMCGSGVAYFFVAMEALADGGVKMGLPRDLALRMAAQTVAGAGRLATQTGRHPAQLKDEVCSPAGTTIAGVHTLENAAFRGALISAVESAVKVAMAMANETQFDTS